MNQQNFDTIRDRLEKQYQDIKFIPHSGWNKDQLRAAFARHCAANPDEPRIITKAWLLHLLCQRARIAAEPDDYFVGKMEHHNLLLELRNKW